MNCSHKRNLYNFVKIIIKLYFRYESTIAAQFFGHTHYDEFELFYDTTDLGRALSVAYIGPSVSPYYDLNPGYRIYYVDGDHSKTTRVSKLFIGLLFLKFFFLILHKVSLQ